ncbi:MAG: primosomal protein N' [Arcobacter butzleri]|nr:primosomal protein N' [Aliarcobacter butzleri]
MKYYELSIIGSNMAPLSYQYSKELDIGRVVEVRLKNRKNTSKAVVLKEVEKPDFKCVDIDSVSSCFFSKQMLDIAKFISSYYISHLGICLNLFTPFDNNITLLQIDPNINDNINLSSKQMEALEFIDKQKVSLLFADTGSGKTEIYIKLIKEALLEGKQALLMMPEISLTPQMQKRLKAVFGDQVALWHSKVSKKTKDDTLNKLQNGTIKIIAGARSALFLPFSKLGLIVVDEEHDDSYKSNQNPKYNAKDLAIFIGNKFNIKVLLGSATPSLVTYHKIAYFRLSQTYYQTKKKFIFDTSNLGLNDFIINKIKNTIDNNNQVIVFLPTRANFKYQICDSCGESIKCPYCSVAMSLHKNHKILKCHYCGYSEGIKEQCPSCNIGIIKNFRLGTAEVESSLKEILDGVKISRFDRDEISSETKLKKVLSDFNDNKIQILIGTQMLSKGHDYHNVKLAVILGIDSILSSNNYRSRENALSLLLQIAGRSGRKGDGEVLIQTKNKEFFYSQITNDYKEFLDSELEFRKDLYPPFVKLAKLSFVHQNHKIAYDNMQQTLQLLFENKNIQIIGFGEEGVFKIANKYRYQILLRSKSPTSLLEAIYAIKNPTFSVDMDTI